MNSTHKSHLYFAIPNRELKVWAWLLIFTFCFNAAFPAVIKNTLFSSSDKVLLCYAGSYQWVSLLSIDTSQGKDSHCVYCLNKDESGDLALFVGSILGQVLSVSFKSQLLNSITVSQSYFLPFLRAPPRFSRFKTH